MSRLAVDQLVTAPIIPDSAARRIINKICVVNAIGNIIVPHFCPENILLKISSKWPAIILTVNRIADVTGRIMSLIVSMIMI